MLRPTAPLPPHAGPSTGSSPTDAAGADGFPARLLAEAVRTHEEALGRPLDEAGADAAGRAAGGDLERRLLGRAGALSVADGLRTAFARLRAGTVAALAIGLVAALAAGVASARLVLGSYADGPVNFFLALVSLLGLHTLMLLVWLGVMLFRPRGASFALLGGMVLGLGRRLAGGSLSGPLELAAVRAAGAVATGSAVGRWALSTISHAMWSAYLLGCLAAVLLLLGTRQYDFVWETTILSEPDYVAVADAIAAPVRAMGFPVPDAAQVAASRRTGAAGAVSAGRENWGGLLVGCIVVYGVLPRCLALLVGMVALRRARTRYRLDTTRIGFARLQGRLMPVSASTGIVDPDEPDGIMEPARTTSDPEPPIGEHGPVALLRMEMEPAASGWPPVVPGVEWWDLGLVDGRAARAAVVQQVRTAPMPPRAVVLACSLAATPDRGTAAFVRALRNGSPVAVLMLLTDGQRLRARVRAADAEQRIADWRDLARNAGIGDERILDVDLEHITEASRLRLSRLLSGGPQAAPMAPGQQVERDFALIARHAAAWSGAPDAAARAELHRAIGKLHGSGEGGWQDLFDISTLDTAKPLQSLQRGAQRMTALLPARLRLDPRWLAAGTAGGALACVAAATFIAPVAIASLPIWAGLGAALSFLVAPSKTTGSVAADHTADLGPAVAAAALFALVLALQGRDEAEIGRILDRTAGDDEPPPLPDADAARAWLDGLRARFDRALSLEGVA